MVDLNTGQDNLNTGRLSVAPVDPALNRTRAAPIFTGASLSDEVAEKQRLNSPLMWAMFSNNSPLLESANSTTRSERDWTNFLLQYGNVINHQQLLDRQEPLSQGDLLQLDMNDERVAEMQLYSDGRGSYYTQGMLSTGRFDVRDVELRPINARAARGEVIDAIQRASAEVGVDVDFMMRMAQQESGFNSNARAGTSSASGLYQFIDSTWSSMQRQYPELRGESRFDPHASALAAAYFARDNAVALERSLGREVNHADLYAAHFMGLGGARTFLRELQENPNAIAANQMPAAARANRNIFYERDGTPRTNAQIYHEVFGSKFDRNDDWRPDAGQTARTALRRDNDNDDLPVRVASRTPRADNDVGYIRAAVDTVSSFFGFGPRNPGAGPS